MKRACGLCLLFAGMVGIPVLGIGHLFSFFDRWSIQQLLDQFVTVDEVLVAVVLLLLLAWAMLLCDLCIAVTRKSSDIDFSFVRRPMTWIVGTLAITPQIQPSITATPPSQSVPVTALVSPAIAASVLRHVLARRREQISTKSSPDRFTIQELSALSTIAHHADGALPSDNCDVDLLTDIDVVQVLRAVNRPLVVQPDTSSLVLSEWSAVVQLFGYPQVLSTNGSVATFRKKRSLELLTWLSLNRDRPRRSAARTALWDFDVNDSTFSTIVSDMRRGLIELSSVVPRQEWVPVTFTDLIPLSPRVVTDAELLQQALEKFREDTKNIEELLTYLGWIRDVPFAGTTYSWADLDGTTTRLVILAMNACREVAQWAAPIKHARALDIATSAGLRLMPGDEELLAVLAVT